LHPGRVVLLRIHCVGFVYSCWWLLSVWFGPWPGWNRSYHLLLILGRFALGLFDQLKHKFVVRFIVDCCVRLLLLHRCLLYRLIASETSLTSLDHIGEVIVLNGLRQAGGRRKLVCLRLQSLMRHLVGDFPELVFKLRKMWVLNTYLNVLLLLIYASLLWSLHHNFIRHWQHANSEIIGGTWVFAIELLFKGLPLFNNFFYAPANIVELKMRSCDRAGIFLVVVVFSVNPFVVSKVDIVAVGVSVYCGGGCLGAFSGSPSILIVSHLYYLNFKNH